MERNVRYEQPSTSETFKSIEEWRPDEQQRVRLGAEHHLAFDLQALHKENQFLIARNFVLNKNDEKHSH